MEGCADHIHPYAKTVYRVHAHAENMPSCGRETAEVTWNLAKNDCAVLKNVNCNPPHREAPPFSLQERITVHGDARLVESESDC